MKPHPPALAAGVLLALATTAPAAAEAKPRAAAPQCFVSNSWRGWTASKDGDALYLRMDNRDVYRVGLTPGARVRKYPGTFLVSEVRGSPWICSSVDLDLTLADHIGLRQALIPQSLRKLTPAEVAALPKAERP